VLCYADSGDVSGDKTAVVGYAAAVLGTFPDAAS
jgi:AmmeMemoRadiSam system protein B